MSISYNAGCKSKMSGWKFQGSYINMLSPAIFFFAKMIDFIWQDLYFFLQKKILSAINYIFGSYLCAANILI